MTTLATEAPGEGSTPAISADGVEDLVRSSAELLKSGDKLGSLALANRALAASSSVGLNPASATACRAAHRRAVALREMGDPIAALETYRAAILAASHAEKGGPVGEGEGAAGGGGAWAGGGAATAERSGAPSPSEALRSATLLLVESLPSGWLARVWARRLSAAQDGHSAFTFRREGAGMKAVPRERRLEAGEEAANLREALATWPALADQARERLIDGWHRGCARPGRGDLALLRGAAYAVSGDSGQALADATTALAYGADEVISRARVAWTREAKPPVSGPEAVGSPTSTLTIAKPGDVAASTPAEDWAEDYGDIRAARSVRSVAPLALASWARERRGENVLALLLALRAREAERDEEGWEEGEKAEGRAEAAASGAGQGGEGTGAGSPEGPALSPDGSSVQGPGGAEGADRALPISPVCALGEPTEHAVHRLLNRVPEEAAEMARLGGAQGLENLLSWQLEEAKPEIHRRRPKYYYYYEWMRRRIQSLFPSLPEPVMDKLLTLDANELDLVLRFPQATKRLVGELCGVLAESGEAALETHPVPLMSWEETQETRGEGGVLALGGSYGGGALALDAADGVASAPPPSQAMQGPPPCAAGPSHLPAIEEVVELPTPPRPFSRAAAESGAGKGDGAGGPAAPLASPPRSVSPVSIGSDGRSDGAEGHLEGLSALNLADDLD